MVQSATTYYEQPSLKITLQSVRDVEFCGPPMTCCATIIVNASKSCMYQFWQNNVRSGTCMMFAYEINL